MTRKRIAPAVDTVPEPATLVASEEALTRLISQAQEKLHELQTQGAVAANRDAAKRQIETAENAVRFAADNVARFEQLVEAALSELDAAVEQQFSDAPPLGQFGAPQPGQANARSQAASAKLFGLKQSLAQQRITHARLVRRLAEVRVAQGAHAA